VNDETIRADYEAPALRDVGSVADFTHEDSGSSQSDGTTTNQF
jgi:hypothetical protein